MPLQMRKVHFMRKLYGEKKYEMTNGRNANQIGVKKKYFFSGSCMHQTDNNKKKRGARTNRTLVKVKAGNP